ncbi:hypothetical protein EDD15DRAFT_2258081 [Pisolithus albus]|nr:hypothetical protein EDD15DRAFT_2258081 [Pisolithus albus]
MGRLFFRGSYVALMVLAQLSNPGAKMSQDVRAVSAFCMDLAVQIHVQVDRKTSAFDPQEHAIQLYPMETHPIFSCS